MIPQPFRLFSPLTCWTFLFVYVYELSVSLDWFLLPPSLPRHSCLTDSLPVSAHSSPALTPTLYPSGFLSALSVGSASGHLQ